MLKYIHEYGVYVEITGYQDVDFDKVEAFLKTSRKQTRQNFEIQFFDAELIATPRASLFRNPKCSASLQEQNKPLKEPSHGNNPVCFSSASNTKSYRTLRDKTSNQKHGNDNNRHRPKANTRCATSSSQMRWQ